MKKILAARKLEDIVIIDSVEKLLVVKRGYIFKMPAPNTPVVLNVSGGLDSTVLWGILMEEYKLVVYPVFFYRGQKRSNREVAAVEYFSHYFKKRYAKNFKKPAFVNVYIPPKEIRSKITEHSQEPLHEITGERRGIPLYSAHLVFNAVQYCTFLELTEKVKIRTIFCSFVRSDGQALRYETLTAMRILTRTLCELTSNYEWQVTALALEKEMGFFWDKDVLIKWANERKYPIEKTFSCISNINYKSHCGECFFCKYRKLSFQRAKVQDKTKYRKENAISQFFS